MKNNKTTKIFAFIALFGILVGILGTTIYGILEVSDSKRSSEININQYTPEELEVLKNIKIESTSSQGENLNSENKTEEMPENAEKTENENNQNAENIEKNKEQS